MSTQAAALKRKLKRNAAKEKEKEVVTKSGDTPIKSGEAAAPDQSKPATAAQSKPTDSEANKKGSDDRLEPTGGKPEPKGTAEIRAYIAHLALQEVRTVVPLGSTNTINEADLHRLNNFFTARPSPIFPFTNHDPRQKGELKTTAEAVKAAIIKTIEYLNTSGRSLNDCNLKEKEIKAFIATTLYCALLQTRVNWLIPPKSKSLQEHLELILTTSAIAKLFKAGNCVQQAYVALEFLLRKHSATKNIFPLHILNISKNEESPHAVLLMGDFPTVKDVYTLDSLMPNVRDREGCLVIDPWTDKVFRLVEWNSQAHQRYRGKDVEFSCSATITNLKQCKALAQFQIDVGKTLGVTVEEVDAWVDALYKICTGSYKMLKPQELNAFEQSFVSGYAQMVASRREPHNRLIHVAPIGGGQLQEQGCVFDVSGRGNGPHIEEASDEVTTAAPNAAPAPTNKS